MKTKYGEFYPIKGLENSNYMISRNGDVLNAKTGKLMDGGHNYAGYKTVQLRVDHKVMTKFVHRLVAETFIDNPMGKEIVNHKNEDKGDCRVCNLEWVSFSENIQYGTAMERSAFKRQTPIEELNESGNVIRWYASAKYLCEMVGIACSNESRPSSLYRAINDGRKWNGMRLRWADNKGEA